MPTESTPNNRVYENFTIEEPYSEGEAFDVCLVSEGTDIVQLKRLDNDMFLVDEGKVCVRNTLYLLPVFSSICENPPASKTDDMRFLDAEIKSLKLDSEVFGCYRKERPDGANSSKEVFTFGEFLRLLFRISYSSVEDGDVYDLENYTSDLHRVSVRRCAGCNKTYSQSCIERVRFCYEFGRLENIIYPCDKCNQLLSFPTLLGTILLSISQGEDVSRMHHEFFVDIK